MIATWQARFAEEKSELERSATRMELRAKEVDAQQVRQPRNVTACNGTPRQTATAVTAA